MENKPAEPPKMEITQKDYQNFQEVFRNFTNELRASIDSLKQIKNESVSLRDEGRGLVCDMSSSSISANNLLELCGKGVQFLRENQTKKIPIGVN